MKAEPAVLESALECGDEFAAKDTTEHFNGKKEVVAWRDPVRAIGRETTGRHHAMHMRVEFKFLTPGMQHAEEADFGTEMLGFTGQVLCPEVAFGAIGALPRPVGADLYS
jgi:hypothetical protein